VGSARCRADKIGDDTYAAELTRKVKNTSGHKSELMSSIMKIIKVLTVCLCFAIITATVTLAVKIAATGNDPTIWNGLTLSLKDPVTWSLIVLTDGMFGVGMIPSGLVLTTSVALMVSIAGLTKKQTLVQELYSLENLSRVDVICLDKTGTLTTGKPAVTDILPGDEEEFTLLMIAAALESKSEHPFARAILERAKEIPVAEAEDFETLPGRGITATVGAVRYYGGNRRLME
jgi:cation transport ATPase